MRRTPRQKQLSRAQGSRRAVVSLDPTAQEAIARFVRVLARCGCRSEDIEQEVLKACRSVPKSWAKSARARVSEMDAAAHVLTLWFSDPAYLDASGRPLPLETKGAERSLEELSRRVDPALDVERVLQHLLRRSVLRRAGKRYVPRDRVLSFRGSGPPYHARSLQTLAAMLSTLEHNSWPQSSTPGWFEAFAANARVPVSAVAAIGRWLRRHGKRLLEDADEKFHSYERKRAKDEPTARIALGIYQFGEELTPEPAAKRSRRHRK